MDNGSEGGTNIYAGATYSGVLSGRNYTTNQILPVVSGLQLGMHTVKIRSYGAYDIGLLGFDILNENASLTITAGNTFVNRKKVSNGLTTLPFKPTSYSTTRGARVRSYKNSDGTLGQVFSIPNSSALYLSSSDHTNEEMVREYNFREFSCGRADDFGVPAFSSATLSFTLDDNLTTLLGSAVTRTAQNSTDCFYGNLAGSFITFTFYGSGLDIVSPYANTMDAHTIYVDGVSVGSLTSTTWGTMKICSGLPLGTHHVKIVRTAVASGSFFIQSFKVYCPKAPSIPVNSALLAEYYVNADYVAGVVSGTVEAISSGVIHKQSLREFTYCGTWTAYSGQFSVVGGQYCASSTIGSYFEYSFVGTGLNIIATVGTGTVAIDGVTYTGAATAIGTGSSFSAGTWTAGSVNGGGLLITGLTFGVHKVRVTLTTAISFNLAAIHVITPIYCPVYPTGVTYQNVMTIGNTSVMDMRNFSSTLISKKKYVMTQGITSGINTTVTSAVPMLEMSTCYYSEGEEVELSTHGVYFLATAGVTGYLQFFVNGVSATTANIFTQNVSNYYNDVSLVRKLYLPKGFHFISLFWWAGSATIFTRSSAQLTVTRL